MSDVSLEGGNSPTPPLDSLSPTPNALDSNDVRVAKRLGIAAMTRTTLFVAIAGGVCTLAYLSKPSATPPRPTPPVPTNHPPDLPKPEEPEMQPRQRPIVISPVKIADVPPNQDLLNFPVGIECNGEVVPATFRPDLLIEIGSRKFQLTCVEASKLSFDALDIPKPDTISVSDGVNFFSKDGIITMPTSEFQAVVAALSGLPKKTRTMKISTRCTLMPENSLLQRAVGGEHECTMHFSEAIPVLQASNHPKEKE